MLIQHSTPEAIMSGNFVRSWAQVSMGVLVCLLVVFGFYIFSR
jgi:hypothetical protein